MNTSPSLKKRKELGTRFAAGLTVILASAALAGRAVADPPVTMAPPIESSNGQYSEDGSGDVSRNSVFNWSEIPENQQVPIRRAVFDRGGYQLYDTAGETIVVPFTNNNLYVMKFAVSPDGSTYFVHTDGAPVLYIPRGSSLENASVPGARWYPFSENFHPSTPIFLGIAPSYSDFIGMGWYPDMYCYGGYYGHRSFLAGGIFLPSFGLEFVIGGRSYDGWEPYHHYYHEHSAPYRLTIIDNNYYRGSYHHDDVFRGGGRGGYDNHSFRGGDHGGYAYHSYGGGHTYSGGGHTFRGAGDGWAHQSNGGTHSFGDSQTYGGGTHTFQGGRSGGSSDHGYGGGSSDHNYGGSHGSFGGARQVDPQVHSQYSGGQRPAFSGGQRPAFSDGRSSAGYSRPSGDGGNTRSSGGGGGYTRPSGGGGNNRASSDGGGHDHASGGGGRGDGGGDHGGDHNR